ncbi:MAG: hypothetical protein BroJett013_06730 [Alphaproteobacteria bacterium]|nr:MAG: hypothetical protein BroJett013_06730 [Alphaproteobacteria bacterium]
MSEMVERAARAIAKQHGTDPDREGPGHRHAVPMEDGTTAIITDHFGPLWKMWTDDARAALSAALDPEDEKLVEIVARDMYAKHEPPIRADLLTWDELTLFQQNNWRRLVCNALAALKAHALGEKP